MLKRFILLIVIGITFLLACNNFIPLAFASTVKIDPASQEVQAGDTINVDVKVENVTDLYGFQLCIIYDPNVLAEPRVYKGNFLDRSFATFVDGDNVEDKSSPGRTKLLGMTLLGNVGGKSGSGTLMKFAFRAKRAGKSPITQGNLKFLNSGSADIAATAQSGEVQVEGEAPYEPSPPTPSPESPQEEPEYPPVPEEETRILASPFPYDMDREEEPPFSPSERQISPPTDKESQYYSPGEIEEGVTAEEEVMPEEKTADTYPGAYEKKQETKLAYVEPDLPEPIAPEIPKAAPPARVPYKEPLIMEEVAEKEPQALKAQAALIFKIVGLALVLVLLVVILKKLKVF